MIYDLYWLLKHATETQREIAPTVWVPARPASHGFRARVKAAWEVLCGRADAFKWPGGQ